MRNSFSISQPGMIVAMLKTLRQFITKRSTIRAFAILIIVCLVIIALIYAPDYLIEPGYKQTNLDEYLKRKNEIRAIIAQLLAGFAVLYGIYLGWQRIEVSKEEQLTNRFAKAIELLASEAIEVRLGAIYALERIAKDSPKDHWTIMEILTATVREKRPITPVPETPAASEDNPDSAATETPEPELPKAEEKLPTDIQAILTVIGRRNLAPEKYTSRFIDLSHSNLRKAILFKAHLECADLTEAHLEGALLFKPHLEGAYLNRAHLEGARLFEPHFKHTTLLGANLEGTDLSNPKSLTKKQISEAIIDKNTKLPDYLTREVEPDSDSPPPAAAPSDSVA